MSSLYHLCWSFRSSQTGASCGRIRTPSLMRTASCESPAGSHTPRRHGRGLPLTRVPRASPQLLVHSPGRDRRLLSLPGIHRDTARSRGCGATTNNTKPPAGMQGAASLLSRSDGHRAAIGRGHRLCRAAPRSARPGSAALLWSRVLESGRVRRNGRGASNPGLFATSANAERTS